MAERDGDRRPSSGSRRLVGRRRCSSMGDDRQRVAGWPAARRGYAEVDVTRRDRRRLGCSGEETAVERQGGGSSGVGQRPDSGLARQRQRRRRGIDSGAVNGAEQLRGDALSDRSILDEGCDSTRFDDVRLRMNFKGYGEVMLSNLVVI
ncbi:hypothetical protein Scep_008975 [Stephania cephalantha]|uniref:Uncharacterized protein n=1 Tax=Stephania cephalantha TaxID=152367 RepID=A0AAP0JT04_9MAGN